MFNNCIKILLCMIVICLSSSLSSFAEEGGIRIAVVRIQEAFNDYERTKEMRKIIETSFQQQKDAVEKLAEEIEAMKAEMRKDSAKLIPGSYQMFERLQNIKNKEYLHKTQSDSYREDLNGEMVNFYQTIFGDFQNAVGEYAKQANIDIVIRSADQELKNKDAFGIQNEIGLKIIHYYRPALDITAQVIQVMNRNYQATKKAK